MYFFKFQEIPGLTDGNVPRRLGPKRASKIRKLFNLSKEDDVRRYVVKRLLPAKEGKENAKPRYKVRKIIWGNLKYLYTWKTEYWNTY